LNDPLEGVFGMVVPKEVLDRAEGNTAFEKSASFWLSHNEEINKYRLCCFSKSPHEILMWSCYGNGHSGICIEIDCSNYANWVQNVEYISDLSDVTINTVKELFRYKHEKWKHEDEARIVLPLDVKEKYLHAEITKVLVGGRIFDSRAVLPLLKLCHLKGYPVDLVTFSNSGEFNGIPIKNLDPDEWRV
jgi:hypothetical protein